MERYHGQLLSDGTRRFLERPRRMLIGAEWVEAASGETLAVIDPANGEKFASVPAGGAADIDRAVAAARRAFESGDWPKMRPVDRERLLLKFADLVEANAQELAEIESLDNGKPVTMARHVDVALVVDFLRYDAGLRGWRIDSEAELVVPGLKSARNFFVCGRRLGPAVALALAVTISVDGLHDKTIVLEPQQRNLNLGLVDPLLLPGLDARFCLDFHWQDEAGRRVGDARDAVLITHFVVDDQLVQVGQC